MYQINQLACVPKLFCFDKTFIFSADSDTQMRNFSGRLIIYYNPRVNNITTKTKIQQHYFRIVATSFHETLM